ARWRRQMRPGCCCPMCWSPRCPPPTTCRRSWRRCPTARWSWSPTRRCGLIPVIGWARSGCASTRCSLQACCTPGERCCPGELRRRGLPPTTPDRARVGGRSDLREQLEELARVAQQDHRRRVRVGVPGAHPLLLAAPAAEVPPQDGVPPERVAPRLDVAVADQLRGADPALGAAQQPPQGERARVVQG